MRDDPFDESNKPQGLVMVTDTGQRIPIDLRLAGIDIWTGTRHWQPVIEGDLNKVMPHVVAFDGPPVAHGEAVSFFEDGPGWDTAEWGHRLMENSKHVFAWYGPGPGPSGEGLVERWMLRSYLDGHPQDRSETDA